MKTLSNKPDVFTLIRSHSKLYALAADGIYSVVGDRLIPIVGFHFSNPAYGLLAYQDMNGRIFIADSHSLYLFDGKSVRLLSSGLLLFVIC